MKRNLYFAVAMLFAAMTVLGTLGGYCFTIYMTMIMERSFEEALHAGNGIGFLFSTIGTIGWIAFSYLFVREDELGEDDDS